MRGSEERGRRLGRLKVFVGVVVVAFAVTLAVMVGNRLSEEALGVLAGAVCGVGAAIPTSLIVVAVSRRQGEGGSGYGRVREREPEYEPRHSYPPVVVVSPQGGRPRSVGWEGLRGIDRGYPPASLRRTGEREFTVVGGAPDAAERMWQRDHGR